MFSKSPKIMPDALAIERVSDKSFWSRLSLSQGSFLYFVVSLPILVTMLKMIQQIGTNNFLCISAMFFTFSLFSALIAFRITYEKHGSFKNWLQCTFLFVSISCFITFGSFSAKTTSFQEQSSYSLVLDYIIVGLIIPVLLSSRLFYFKVIAWKKVIPMDEVIPPIDNTTGGNVRNEITASEINAGKQKLQKAINKEKNPVIKSALEALSQNRATLDDIITLNRNEWRIWPKYVYHCCVETLKRHHVHFNLPEISLSPDMLLVFVDINQPNMTTDTAMLGLLYELLTPKQVIDIIKKNKDNLPKTIQALSEPNPNPDHIFTTVYEKER